MTKRMTPEKALAAVAASDDGLYGILNDERIDFAPGGERPA